MPLQRLESKAIVAALALLAVSAVAAAGPGGASGLQAVAAEATAAEATAAEAVAAEDGAQPRPGPAMPATVVAAAVTEVRAQVPVSGTLVAERPVQIFARLTGYEIVEITADAGDVVAAGRLLARLSDGIVRAQLEQAKAEYQRATASLDQARSQVSSTDAALAQAEAALERAQKLRDSGNASQATLDQALSAAAAARAAATSSSNGVAVAEAQLAQAAAAREVARLNLEHTRITAPVAGLITARKAELGALPGGGEPLFSMVADGRIEMAGEVIETALGKLAPGQPARLRIAGVGDVAGTVRRVPAGVDATTRLGVVRISLDAAEGLRVGLFGSGWITTEKRDAITVPATALLATEGGDVVQVVAGGHVHTRRVEAGLLWQGRREIIHGLAAGEMVIARSGAFFRDGDPVDPVAPTERPAPAGEAGTEGPEASGPGTEAPDKAGGRGEDGALDKDGAADKDEAPIKDRAAAPATDRNATGTEAPDAADAPAPDAAAPAAAPAPDANDAKTDAPGADTTPDTDTATSVPDSGAMVIDTAGAKSAVGTDAVAPDAAPAPAAAAPASGAGAAGTGATGVDAAATAAPAPDAPAPDAPAPDGPAPGVAAPVPTTGGAGPVP